MANNDDLTKAEDFAENESRRLDDFHEDAVRHFDKSDLIDTTARSSYKKELNALKKVYEMKLSDSNKNMAMEIAASGDDEEKINVINARYLKEQQELEERFKKSDEKLQKKYENEIKFHIHPKLKRKADLIDSDILLSVRNLKQFFFFGNKIHNQKLKAVSNVSFDVKKGECFGIVGESGCGKTTTGRTIIKLYKPTSGSIYYRGFRIGAGSRWNQKEIKWSKVRYRKNVKLYKLNAKNAILALDKESPDFDENACKISEELAQKLASEKLHIKSVVSTQRSKIRQINFDQKHTPKKLMSEIQMIFQDPVDSLDPRMTVEDIIQEGLFIQGNRNKEENHKKVVDILEKVGLVEEHASRYPHEFSGGQRQRIGIARALVMNPKLLICDEPISALDVSIRAQVINLLNDLKDEMGLTLIFIAHDLSVVKYFCDRIAVMYFGKMVELADSDELFRHPLHPYTKSLLSAIPKPNPRTERNRIRILYKPNEVHDYSVDKPSMREVCPGHQVYCNDKEFEEYKKQIADIDKKSTAK